MVPKSLNMGVEDMEEGIEEGKIYRDGKVVIVDSDGSSAAQEAAEAVEQVIAPEGEAIVLEGGANGWLEAGLETDCFLKALSEDA